MKMRSVNKKDWLLGPQEKLTEGIVRDYLGQSERSVSHIAGTADGGRKLQYVRLHKLLKLWWWKLWQRTRLNRCSQLCTQLSCLRRATRRSWVASLSSQGHLAPALLISRIWKRKWAQQPLQRWPDKLSRPHVSMKDNMFGQEQVNLVKNSALFIFIFTRWWNPFHVHMGGYDFKEILAMFSQILCWATPLTTHIAASLLFWYSVFVHLRCTTLIFAAQTNYLALSLLLTLCSTDHYSKSLSFFLWQTICTQAFTGSFVLRIYRNKT